MWCSTVLGAQVVLSYSCRKKNVILKRVIALSSVKYGRRVEADVIESRLGRVETSLIPSPQSRLRIAYSGGIL